MTPSKEEIIQYIKDHAYRCGAGHTGQYEDTIVIDVNDLLDYMKAHYYFSRSGVWTMIITPNSK